MALYIQIILLLWVTGHKVESLYSMANLRLSRERGHPSPSSSPSLAVGCLAACDLRSCPVVNVDTCSGRIEMDQCQCCPVCNMTHVSTNQSVSKQPGGQLEADDPEACDKIECPRQQMCLLNIQGLPVCRCPSSIYCRNRPRRPVCSEESTTYRSMCYLKMQACEEDRRIGLKHKGSCEGNEEAEKLERLKQKKEKQEQRQQKLEKKQQKAARREKKNRKQENREQRKQKQSQKRRRQNQHKEKTSLGKKQDRPDRKSDLGKKDRKEEIRDERRRHRRRLKKILKQDR